MAGQTLPLSSDEFLARVDSAGPPTTDDTTITTDGRHLDSKDAVLAWLNEIDAERAAGRFVDLDDA